MHSPYDPRWEPDPTGQRLATIRAARRGALYAALIFGWIVAAAVWLSPPEGAGAPASPLLKCRDTPECRVHANSASTSSR